MAEAVVEKSALTADSAEGYASTELLTDPQHGEYARNTFARYEELRAFVMKLSLQD
jgi:multidrug resistance protein MdtO